MRCDTAVGLATSVLNRSTYRFKCKLMESRIYIRRNFKTWCSLHERGTIPTALKICVNVFYVVALCCQHFESRSVFAFTSTLKMGDENACKLLINFYLTARIYVTERQFS